MKVLQRAAFPAAMILVVAGVLAWGWLATSAYIANPVVSLSDDWGYLNGGLDKVHSFRDTARWWTGAWCGEVPFWRPLTSYAFWGERLLWPKEFMLPRQIISVSLHLIFVGLGGLLTWRLTGRRWLALLTVWLFAGLRPYPISAFFGNLLPVGDVLSDPKNVPDPLVGIAIMASLLLLIRGRWIASLAAAMISVGFKELGFTTWPLALVVLLWTKHPSSPFPHQRGEGEGLGGRGYRLPTAAWIIALAAMVLVHFLAVGYGYNCGSNRAWFWRAAAYFGGPPGAELVLRNVIPVFVASLLFASMVSLRRMSFVIKALAVIASFGFGALLDSLLQRVSLEVSLVRVLSYGLELKTILICLFWLLIAWEARHDWQTIALGMSLCFVAALPSWMVAQAREHTQYVATFFMEIAVAAALFRAASVGRPIRHKERR